MLARAELNGVYDIRKTNTNIIWSLLLPSSSMHCSCPANYAHVFDRLLASLGCLGNKWFIGHAGGQLGKLTTNNQVTWHCTVKKRGENRRKQKTTSAQTLNRLAVGDWCHQWKFHCLLCFLELGSLTTFLLYLTVSTNSHVLDYRPLLSLSSPL
jgi:hypothetical protein